VIRHAAVVASPPRGDRQIARIDQPHASHRTIMILDLTQTMSTAPKLVLILGGGFAGVYTARYLEKLLRPEEAFIT
jgi:hypothetical protein